MPNSESFHRPQIAAKLAALMPAVLAKQHSKKNYSPLLCDSTQNRRLRCASKHIQEQYWRRCEVIVRNQTSVNSAKGKR